MGIPWTPEKSRKDKSGTRWNFCYWNAGPFGEKSRRGQRLFFWDDRKETSGVVLFLPGKTVRYSQISDLIGKLVAHESIRKQYQRELLFPLEEHHTLFGTFPEEISN
jgi:hypothetical protein